MRTRNPVGRHRSKQRLRHRAKGYWGLRSKTLKLVRETVTRAENYATRDRKQRKRHFRALWIVRLNAAVRDQGLTYSRFQRGLKLADVRINRKLLSELAIHDPKAFAEIVELAKAQLLRSAS